MTPGVAPPYLAAAACPNSWKPADSTVTAKTRISRPGRSNASYAAGGQPLAEEHPPAHDRERGQQGTTIHGRNRNRNGSVSRLRPVGIGDGISEIAAPATGFASSPAGWLPSGWTSRPEGAACGRQAGGRCPR